MNIPTSKWIENNYEPKCYKFFSQARNQEMMLVFEGPWKDWLCFKHADGHWVSLRKATKRDIQEISQAVANHHHGL